MSKINKPPVSECLDKRFNLPRLSSFASQFINFCSPPFVPFFSVPLSSTTPASLYFLKQAMPILHTSEISQVLCHLLRTNQSFRFQLKCYFPKEAFPVPLLGQV